MGFLEFKLQSLYHVYQCMHKGFGRVDMAYTVLFSDDLYIFCTVLKNVKQIIQFYNLD